MDPQNQTPVPATAPEGRGAVAKMTRQGNLAGMKQVEISDVLQGMKSQIAAALPKHMTPDRMIQMAATLIARNPLIASCSASSVLGAVMQASILGFQPVDALGECYFVPYRRNIGTKESPKWTDELQFQIGYKGYLNLARRSGEIKQVYAEVVRKGDVFDYELGLNPVLKHKPLPEATGDISHVYAVVHYKDGGFNFVVLTRQQVEALRKRSPSQRDFLSGAWKTDYDAMAKAKAIKQLSKYFPLSTDFRAAAVTDEAILDATQFMEDGTGIKSEAVYYPESIDITAMQNAADPLGEKEQPQQNAQQAQSEAPKTEVPATEPAKTDKPTGKAKTVQQAEMFPNQQGK